MPFPTAADVAEYLDHVDLSDPEQEDNLSKVVGRARSIVEEALYPVVFTDDWPVAAEEKLVVARFGPYLQLPPHRQGTVSLVTLGGVDLTGYWLEQESGVLYAQDASGNTGDWGDVPYAVTAVWGYGPPPEAVNEIVVELSVNIWRRRHEGLFVESTAFGGGTRTQYIGGLTDSQRAVLDKIVENRLPVGV